MVLDDTRGHRERAVQHERQWGGQPWDERQQDVAREQRLPGRAVFPHRQFLHNEAAGGILLLICALGALIWANSPWGESYDTLWSTELSL